MRHSHDFVPRHVGDELVLVPVTGQAADLENVFTLNAVGARIWQLAAKLPDEGQIARGLVEEYEVDEATALSDVQEVLGQLKQIGAIVD